MRAKVAEDFKTAQNTRLVDDGESQNDIANVKFTFSFDKNVIGKAMLKLPLEYETNISSFLEKVEANPPTNFDDLDTFDPLEVLDFEIQNYKPNEIPAMSQYDPAMRDLPNRPGCEYESVLRQRAGEPDLEKVQIKAHEQQKLLKRDKKEIVSHAIVKMPQSFLKPLDYAAEKVIRADCHPTLREFKALPGTSSTEVDPEYQLYPSARTMVPIRDEIELKKQSVARQLGDNPPVVSATYMLGLSKTVSGSFVNNLDVPTALLPGNFGVRVIDQMMPTNLSDVHRDRRSTQVENLTCDNRDWTIPEQLEEPLDVDYLTDDESDDGQDFEVPVPELDNLIKGFEDGDEKIQAQQSEWNDHMAALKSAGFEKETREEIKQAKATKTQLLDNNITEHRRLLQAALPGMIEDLNAGIADPSNKVSLR